MRPRVDADPRGEGVSAPGRRSANLDAAIVGVCSGSPDKTTSYGRFDPKTGTITVLDAPRGDGP